MSKIDLSLVGILDSRWSLKDLGNGRIKLEYNSFRGMPSSEETKMAVKTVLEAKGIKSLYISDKNGDVEISAAQVADAKFEVKKDEQPPKTERKYDELSRPFGAEENLLRLEEI